MYFENAKVFCKNVAPSGVLNACKYGSMPPSKNRGHRADTADGLMGVAWAQPTYKNPLFFFVP